jgi:hypothetical protein
MSKVRQKNVTLAAHTSNLKNRLDELLREGHYVGVTALLSELQIPPSSYKSSAEMRALYRDYARELGGARQAEKIESFKSRPVVSMPVSSISRTKKENPPMKNENPSSLANDRPPEPSEDAAKTASTNGSALLEGLQQLRVDRDNWKKRFEEKADLLIEVEAKLEKLESSRQGSQPAFEASQLERILEERIESFERRKADLEASILACDENIANLKSAKDSFNLVKEVLQADGNR